MTFPSNINLHKQLLRFVDKTLRLFAEYLLSYLKATLLKRHSGTDVSLRILQNFQECIFCETPANGCFCICQADINLFIHLTIAEA